MGRVGRVEKASNPSAREGSSLAGDVLVVVPVRNEKENLEHVLVPLQEVVRRERYDLVVIDDASTDASRDVLDGRRVRTITLTEKLGYGAALQTGYKYALAEGYDYLIQLDGDGQHDPRFLPTIRRALAEHDFVIGSRFLENNASFRPRETLYKGTPLRRCAIRYFRFLLYAMSGVSITDPTSGYIGMNRKCLRLLSGDLFPDDFPDADVLLSLIRLPIKLREVPVYMYRNDDGGRLHRGLSPLWYMVKVTLSLAVSRLRKLAEV